MREAALILIPKDGLHRWPRIPTLSVSFNTEGFAVFYCRSLHVLLTSFRRACRFDEDRDKSAARTNAKWCEDGSIHADALLQRFKGCVLGLKREVSGVGTR